MPELILHFAIVNVSILVDDFRFSLLLVLKPVTIINVTILTRFFSFAFSFSSKVITFVSDRGRSKSSKAVIKIILPFSGVSLTAGPSDIALSVLLVPGELSIIACAIFQLEKAFQVQVILPLTLERASVRVVSDTETLSIVCFEASFIDSSIL